MDLLAMPFEARVVLAGSPMPWSQRSMSSGSFSSSSSRSVEEDLDVLDEDDDVFEDPFDDNQRRQERKFRRYARARSGRLSDYARWIVAQRSCAREVKLRRSSPLARSVDPTSRRRRSQGSVFAIFSTLCFFAGLSHGPFADVLGDAFAETAPELCDLEFPTSPRRRRKQSL